MQFLLIAGLVGWIGFTGTMNEAGTPVLNNCDTTQNIKCAVDFND